MSKTALSYLDIIRECSDAFDVSMAAYSVSGEYAMIKAAVQGIYLAPAQFEAMFLSFARTEEDIEKTLSAAEEVFSAL